MTTATYNVSGMTCGHCAASVSSEIGKLPGVRDVKVDLGTGAVTVESDQPLTGADVATAIDEAGYQVVTTA